MVKQFMVDREDARQALQLLISRAGFDPADFEIDEDLSGDYIDWSGAQVRALTLRRRGTTVLHTYAVAANSPWMFAPFADLTSGKYGSPVPIARSQAVRLAT